MVAWAGEERIVLVLPERGEGEDMAGKLVGAVLDRTEAGEMQGLGTADRLVLVALAENANVDNRESRLSLRKLGRRVGLGKSTVERALRRLEHAMWITQTRAAVGPCAARYSLNVLSKASVPPGRDGSDGASVPPRRDGSPSDDLVSHPGGTECPTQAGQTVPPRAGHIPSTPSIPDLRSRDPGIDRCLGEASLRFARKASYASPPDSTGGNGTATATANGALAPLQAPAAAAAMPEPLDFETKRERAKAALSRLLDEERP